MAQDDNLCTDYNCQDMGCIRNPRLNWLKRRRLKKQKDTIPTYDTLTHEYEDTEVDVGETDN